MTYIVTKAVPIHNMCIGINVSYKYKQTHTHIHILTPKNYYTHTYIQAHTLCLHIRYSLKFSQG